MWDMPRLLLAAVAVLTSFLIVPSDSIRCFKCDALSQPVSDCPGWHRPPIDTFHDRKDRGGLFTHCLEIKLGNGTIVHQAR